MSDFLGYLDRISGGEQRQRLARIAGVSPSTITRWDPSRADAIQPKADAVIALARHYQQAPLEALVEAGIVTAEETQLREVSAPLADYPHTSLLRELQRRLDQMSLPSGNIRGQKEDPSPDDYDLAAGHVDRPHDRPAD